MSNTTPNNPPGRHYMDELKSIEDLVTQLESRLEIDGKNNRKKLKEEAELARRAEAEQARRREATGLEESTVLVVDDSAAVRAVIVKALVNDFTFVQARNGLEALKIIDTNPRIVLALVDLEMPTLDGYELIRRIRRHENKTTRQMPIIVVTGTKDLDAKRRALDSGADDFLTKEADPVELLARVRTYYKLAQTKQELELRSQALDAAQKKVAAGKAKSYRKTTRKTARKKARAAAPDQPQATAPAATRSAAKPQMRPASSAMMSAPPRNRGRSEHVQQQVHVLADKVKHINSTAAITIGATALVFLGVIIVVLLSRGDKTVRYVVKDTQVLETTAPEMRVAENLVSDALSSSTPQPTQSTRVVPIQTEPVAAKPRKPEPVVAKPKPRSVAKPVKVVKPRPRPVAKPRALPKAKPKIRAPAKPARVFRKPTAAVTPPDALKQDIQTELAHDQQSATIEVAAASPVLSTARLDRFLRRFVSVYEAGDLEQFMELFAAESRTNDRTSKAGIEEDYKDFFSTTELREMNLEAISWDIEKEVARGWGNFKVDILQAGESNTKTYTGSLTFHIKMTDGGLRIVRLYHGQRRVRSR